MRVRIEPLHRRQVQAMAPRVQQAITQALQQESKQLQKDFGLTVKTWKRKPVFVARITTSAVSVSTDNEIYGYVDQGTRPHIIRPRRAKALRFFAKGFVAKTTPGQLTARKGRAASENLTFRQVVAHPGFPGRKFTTLIKANSQKRLAVDLRKAIRKAVDRR